MVDAGWTAPEARGAFGGFIGPKNLVELVRTSAPWLFDGTHPAATPELAVPWTGRLIECTGTPHGWWRILLSAPVHPAPAEHPTPAAIADYFALCCAAHFASAATFVPTDVDAKIRHALWLDQTDPDELQRMLRFTLALQEWDLAPVSARLVCVPGHAPVSGHDGERLSVLGGALIGASTAHADEMVDALYAALDAELQREAEVFRAALYARDRELDVLALAAVLTHNAGDVVQALGSKHAAVVSAERRQNLLELSRERFERYGGAYGQAALVYREMLAAEGHRNYPLRELKCLRKHPSLLYPMAPCVDSWGERIACTPYLTTAERAEVVVGLVEGLRRVQGQSAYQRALAGFAQGWRGGLLDKSLSAHYTARVKRDLDSHDLRKAMETPRTNFEASLKKRARAILARR